MPTHARINSAAIGKLATTNGVMKPPYVSLTAVTSCCRRGRRGGHGVDRYYDPELTFNGFQASVGAQRNGPIPRGNGFVAAGLSVFASCPESGIQTSGENFTQVSQS